jgi:hypothetical protein
MSAKKRDAQTVSNIDVGHLLMPQIRFLRAAGVTLEDFGRILSAEYRRKNFRRRNNRVEHVSVELANHCGILIANWKTQPDFLSNNGRPADLAHRGNGSFAALANLSAPQVRPKKLLDVLTRYGAIKKLPSGKVRLTSKLFNCTHPSGQLIALEPSLAFLADAARVLEDQVGARSSRARQPVRYWREVEDSTVPREFVDEFIVFTKRRVMVLMEEVEDWLDEHKVIGTRGRKRDLMRLGIGIFAIAEKPADAN